MTASSPRLETVAQHPSEPQMFDLVMPTIMLEAGGALVHHVVRGWHWGPAEDAPILRDRGLEVTGEPWQVVSRARMELAALVRRAPRVGSRLSPAIPTVVVVHALTGDARAGGPGGWW